VSLVMGGALPLALGLTGQSEVDDLRAEGFQETGKFRNYVSDLMNRFISMGAGGPLNDYYSAYDTAVLYTGEAITAVEAVEDGGWEWWDDQTSPTQADRERWKKQAEAYHQAVQADKNVLYRVEKGGRLLYTNADTDLSLVVPGGYGFILSFDGSKCAAIKSDEMLDLYGDGVYWDDGEHWYLPGYRNFPVSADAASVEVTLAVADVPAPYVQGDYSTSGVQWQANRLYRLEQNWKAEKEEFRVSCGMVVFGVALVVVYLLLRRDKAQADRAIAKVTGHLWFEVKVLAALASVVLVFLPFSEEMRYLLSEMQYISAYETDAEAVFITGEWFVSGYLREVLRQTWGLLGCFWVCYLFINDLRYGNKPWRHGICGMLAGKDTNGVEKPVRKLTGVVYLLAILLGISLFILFRELLPYHGVTSWECVLILVGIAAAAVLAGVGGLLLRRVGSGLAQAVDQQTRSERMKVELVTNVSHDLKTPLTSIISYAELLEQEHLAPPAGEYVTILGQKAERLRSMVSDVFEVSKAASGNLPVKLERLDLAKLLRQTLADMVGTIEAAPVTLRSVIPEEAVEVVADGDRLYRVFQNLLQNALQYSLEGSRVYLDLTVADGKAVAAVRNTSKTELSAGTDYTARFVRGDASRTDGGSGLGLAIAESFTAACGGTLTVEPVADLFVVKVIFPLA